MKNTKTQQKTELFRYPKRLMLSLYPVIILSFLLFGQIYAETFDTVNNFLVNGDAEQNWVGWNRTANTSLALDSVNDGQYSFELEPSSGAYSELSSELIPARSQDVFLLRFHFKSLEGAVIEPESSFLTVCSFDSDNNLIGEEKFYFQATDGVWQFHEHQVTASLGCKKVNVRMFASPATMGQFRFDNIELFRYIPSMSRGIGGVPDHIYVVPRSILNDAEFIVMQTLQGLLAQTKPEIWINEGNLSLLDDMVANHGITYTEKNTFFWYLDHFKSRISGYVLYDFSDPASLTAANSMAGILNAVAVEDSLESYITTTFGLPRLLDARGKDDQWVYENYWDQFNHDAIVVKTNDPSYHGNAYYFRDWGVAIKSIFWWNDSTLLSRPVYDSIFGNAPVYGWGDAASSDSELNSIQFLSESGLYEVPADWILNLSTLAGMAKRAQPWQFQQPISDNAYSKEQNVHYVAFQVSDMDNVNALVANNNFGVNPALYANNNRGTFAVGWSMPPSLVELAPSAIEWWYRQATENDGFGVPVSGMGYHYPLSFPENELSAQMIKLNSLMKKADLKTLVIGDLLWPSPLNHDTYGHIAEKYASLDQVRGMFYWDGNGDAARYGREADAGRAQRIYWFNGKPFVPCRYTLWNSEGYEGISRTGLQLAQTINSLPTDPKNPDSYTFVALHMWSYGLDEIATCVANLDSDVRVVTPDELIEQIYLNFNSQQPQPAPRNRIYVHAVDDGNNVLRIYYTNADYEPLTIGLNIDAGNAAICGRDAVTLDSFYNVFMDSAYAHKDTDQIGLGTPLANTDGAGLNEMVSSGMNKVSLSIGSLNGKHDNAGLIAEIQLTGSGTQNVTVDLDSLRGGIFSKKGEMVVVGLPVTIPVELSMGVGQTVCGDCGDFAKLLADVSGPTDSSDCYVRMEDLAVLASDWFGGGSVLTDWTGPEGAPDGVVDFSDLMILIDQWLECNDPDNPICY